MDSLHRQYEHGMLGSQDADDSSSFHNVYVHQKITIMFWPHGQRGDVMRYVLWLLVVPVAVGCGNSVKLKGGLTPNTPSTARTIRVPGDAATPELGIQQANTGDTVSATGTFTLTNTLVVKQGVTLDGNGTTTLTTGTSTATTPVVSLASDSTIRGCTITGSATVVRPAVSSIGTQRPKVESCTITTNSGVVFTNVTSGRITLTVMRPMDMTLQTTSIALAQCSSTTVDRNTVIGATTLLALTTSVTSTVRENIFYFSGQIAVEADQASVQSLVMSYNNLFDNPQRYAVRGGGTFTPSPGTGEIEVAPGFVDFSLDDPDVDLRLAPASLCRNVGPSGGPIGALPVVTYKTSLDVSRDVTSPSGNVSRGTATTLLVLSYSPGSTGKAVFQPGHLLVFEVFTVGGALGNPKLLDNSGVEMATVTKNTNGLVVFTVNRTVNLPVGAPSLITVTGDTSSISAGGNIQVNLRGPVSWSDDVIPTINDGITPNGIPANGNPLTLN